MTTQISLAPAAPAKKAVIASLMQLYLYDCSEASGADLDDHGRYPSPNLDIYWAEPGHAPFLICANERIAGFALVNGSSRIRTPFLGRAVADFFILRKYRRQGIGARAAAQLFDHFPGHWEVATFALLIPAHTFWRGVIDRYTHGQYDEVWVRTSAWRGPVQSFVTPIRVGL